MLKMHREFFWKHLRSTLRPVFATSIIPAIPQDEIPHTDTKPEKRHRKRAKTSSSSSSSSASSTNWKQKCSELQANVDKVEDTLATTEKQWETLYDEKCALQARVEYLEACLKEGRSDF